MASNYTTEQVDHMIKAYSEKPDRTTVNMLAEDFDKSIKSIIGKLSREGVYQKAVYKTKTGELLHIVVDTSKELGPSASGKTTLIASSGGNATLDLENGRQVKLGFNLYY